MSPPGSFCCRSRKLQGDEFFAKTRNGKQSTIRITSIALPKSPVSLTCGDEVPHIFTRKPRLQPAEFLNPSAKRLLQQNLPQADVVSHAHARARGQTEREACSQGRSYSIRIWSSALVQQCPR